MKTVLILWTLSILLLSCWKTETDENIDNTQDGQVEEVISETAVNEVAAPSEFPTTSSSSWEDTPAL